MISTQEEELLYQIRKLEDQISEMKSHELWDASVVADLERRRDIQYQLLKKMDGLEPIM